MRTIQLSCKCCTEGITINELLIELLCLPDDERSRIAAELLASLEEVEEEVAERSWATELERRSAEIADGRVQTVAWETARAQLLKELEERRREHRSPS
jgi:putative addiction module component (TIGR02574 family)